MGIGALGGTIAARAIRTGLPVRLAVRNTDSAEALRRSGLRVSGIGGEVRADAIDVAAVGAYFILRGWRFPQTAGRAAMAEAAYEHAIVLIKDAA